METLQILAKALTVILCAFILVISFVAHASLKEKNFYRTKEIIRRSEKQTVGGRVYYYCLVLFCLNGFWWGATYFMYGFLFAAVMTERLITYRICRGDKDKLGKFLAKINW